LTLVRTSTGGYQIYAGTETNLYKLDTTTAPYPWEDVSRLAGGAYALPPGDQWSFVRYGSRLMGFELADTPQFIDVDAGTDFANLPNAPTARFGWVAGDFLVAGYNASFPNRVRWSAFNNSEAWELQVRGASLQDINYGNEVQGGIGSEDGAIIFQRNAITTMSKTLDVSAAFTFQVVNPYRGTIAPYSLAVAGVGLIFYLSEDGFYMGGDGQPIGAEKIDRWFLNEQIDRDYLQEVTAAVDPFSKIVWFAYRKVDGSKARVGFNWQLQRWCYSDINVTQIAALATPGITWDGLDGFYATIDDVDEPFDSRLFAGGRPTMAGFDADTFQLGWFTGENAAVTLETADIALSVSKQGKPQRTFLIGARLVGDCTDFTLMVGTSDYPGGLVTWTTAKSPHPTTGICPFRSSGLYHRFRLEIPEGADWKVVSGLETFETEEGTR
jgi:hypothetical protein